MPLTGLVLLVLGGVYAYVYETSPDRGKQENTNTKVARYARIVCPMAGVILLLIWVVGEIV
jgi:hypothetical protein